jgi:hypothetical protein
LARLRQQQLFAVRDHERKQAEQKRQLALLQSRQSM